MNKDEIEKNIRQTMLKDLISYFSNEMYEVKCEAEQEDKANSRSCCSAIANICEAKTLQKVIAKLKMELDKESEKKWVKKVFDK